MKLLMQILFAILAVTFFSCKKEDEVQPEAPYQVTTEEVNYVNDITLKRWQNDSVGNQARLSGFNFYLDVSKNEGNGNYSGNVWGWNINTGNLESPNDPNPRGTYKIDFVNKKITVTGYENYTLNVISLTSSKLVATYNGGAYTNTRVVYSVKNF